MATQEQLLKTRALWRQHPEIFAKQVLDVDLYDRQTEICNSIRDNRITTVASCNAAGKTGTAGIVVPWYLLCWDGSIVVTTAPTWRQVKDLLWREINNRYETAKAKGIIISPSPPNVVSWQLSANWYAVGVSSKHPDKVMGYHADSGHLLAICDEASAIEEPIFGGIDSLLTSEDCRLLYIGNPTSPVGRFRESHKPGFKANKIRISAFDTPNFKANNIANEEQLIAAIDSGRKLKVAYNQLISPIWVYERINQWGINSPMYQAKVLAKFPEVGENTLIPLSWIEAATSDERLERVLGINLKQPHFEMTDEAVKTLEAQNSLTRNLALDAYIKASNINRGVDVARFGSDSTVITPRWHKIVGEQSVYHKEDTMQTAGRVWPLIRNTPTDFTGIDVIGVGAGVVDRLHELQRIEEAQGHGQWANISAVNVADSPTEKPEGMAQMEFANKRAELYWKLARIFEAGDIYLMPNKDGKPPDDLMYELSAIQYEFRGNKIFIEEKKEMKKRLAGKSPDRADSLVLSYAFGSSGAGWHVEETDQGLFSPSDHDEDIEEEPERARDMDDVGMSNELEQVY